MGNFHCREIWDNRIIEAIDGDFQASQREFLDPCDKEKRKRIVIYPLCNAEVQSYYPTIFP